MIKVLLILGMILTPLGHGWYMAQFDGARTDFKGSSSPYHQLGSISLSLIHESSTQVRSEGLGGIG